MPIPFFVVYELKLVFISAYCLLFDIFLIYCLCYTFL